MALIYDYDKCIGSVTVRFRHHDNIEFQTYELYEGNAFLIAILRGNQENHDNDRLAWFFTDRDHSMNCLGLKKGSESIFEDDYFVNFAFQNIRKSRHVHELIPLLVKAYPDLTIFIN